ncbi:MAG: carbon-nitrogen hydrolase family protein [Bryobacteraceae bacterium]
MKVAAYQCPLLPSGSMGAINLIRRRVRSCESEGVLILCCPEVVLGGLADYSRDPAGFAIDVERGDLDAVLAPLASDTVTTIIGFTEIASGSRLYNAAAILQNGVVVGLYRKLHPAINKSVYQPGDRLPVFTVGGLTFGILICNDSNFPEPARIMAAQGAAALFVPTNNGLPANRAGLEIVMQTRNVDIARAIDNRVPVIRADVAGRAGDLVSHGSSAIVDSGGTVLQSAPPLSETLLVADIETAPRVRT